MLKHLCCLVVALLATGVAWPVLPGSDNPGDFVSPEDLSCGARCVYVLCRFHNIYTPLEEIMKALPASSKGNTMLDLKKALESAGFCVRGLSGDYEAILNCAKLPAIIHMQPEQHYVLLYAIDEESASVADPAGSMYRFRRDVFLKKWTGSLLEATPKGPKPEEAA